MKNFIFLPLFLMICGIVNAQTIYTGSSTLTSHRVVGLGGFNLSFQPNTGSFFINGLTGKIGINTSTPAESLDVNGNLQAKIGYFTNSLANGQTFSSVDDRNAKSMVFSGGALLNATSKARTFNFLDFPSSNIDSSPSIHLSLNDRAYKNRMRFWAAQAGASSFFLSDKNEVVNFIVSDNGSNVVDLILPKATSRLGIGTSSFVDGTDVYSLSVNGNVRAERVKVYTTWADYVFEEDYVLPTLEEVEKHIKENGHLQDIPSACEVESNGIELGEMNRLLLQKIEELTLYTIELNKQVQELKSQINNK